MPELPLELLPFAFVAGMATFFSPCAGALLPMYLSLYLSREERSGLPARLRGLEGLALGGVISAGFLTSLGVLGLLFALLGSAVGRYIPWVGVAVGALLVVTGIALLIKPSALDVVEGRISRRLHKLLPAAAPVVPSAAGGSNPNPAPYPGSSGLLSFYVYGMVYAVCAAACTLPIFLAVMTQTILAGGLLGGFLSFAAYGWGMSLMMLVFAVLIAYSKALVLRVFGRVGRWVQRTGGLFMIAAGGYTLYYLLIYGRYLDELLGR